jgi:Acyl-CoA dehydrogenase, C-terminal domain
VQMLGARGFLDTNIVGQFFRDYRLFRIFEGATEAVTVYLGSSILKAPQEFFALLDTQFDASSSVRELRVAVADLAEQATTSEAHRHLLANAIGDIACWTVIAGLTSAVARRSGTTVDTYTAHWCEHKLRERIRTAQHELHTSHRPPAVDILNDHIVGYESVIGDIEQTLPGEHRELDKLLHARPG